MVGGARFADNFSTLVAPGGGIIDDLNIDERGHPMLGIDLRVWTGTRPNGTSASQNCENWSSNSDLVNARVGDLDTLTDAWTFSSVQACITGLPLYCFEQ